MFTGSTTATRRWKKRVTRNDARSGDRRSEEIESARARRCGLSYRNEVELRAERFPKPKYILCNADESEPGTCKDRPLMEHEPHQLIEGMTIAGRAIGSKQGYIYIRGEYRYVLDIVDRGDRGSLCRGLSGQEYSRQRVRFRSFARIRARGLTSAAKNRR